jgi:hypothetical protein
LPHHATHLSFPLSMSVITEHHPPLSLITHFLMLFVFTLFDWQSGSS